MIRYRYNQQVSHPAPFVHVTVRGPLGGPAVSNLPAQLDTAADLTVLPWRIVAELGLLEHDRIEALGFGGHVTRLPTYLIQLQIHEFEPATIEVLVSRGEPHVLLGRDVLDGHRLILDGPGLVLELD
jgi:predicted aspartyl protease